MDEGEYAAIQDRKDLRCLGGTNILPSYIISDGLGEDAEPFLNRP